MKTTLQAILTLITTFSFAQAPITNFFSLPMSQYALVEPTGGLDQTTAGANMVWDFTNLTPLGVNTDTYAAPTSQQLQTYPGTTNVLSITTTGSDNVNTIFAKNEADNFYFTGVSAGDIILNYNSDNAFLGTFPLMYQNQVTDAVGGTFSSPDASGSFVGTIVTTVDAHGTLTTNNVGQGAYTGNVTRLKVVQNLTLTVVIFEGTVTQTSYYYYDNASGNLIFRSNTATVVFDLVNVNETISTYESFLSNPLSQEVINQDVADAFQVVPNPVSEVLTLKNKYQNPIKSIRVCDMHGRKVAETSGPLNTIGLPHLAGGMYVVYVQTENGIFTQKFLKK
ncbi:T9SS type A sorting domain-containing protein [Bizionia sediminis]|uniref:T9SS type A sorting domain-containing protein n=1 Tax=Bizionia sediminis TaxID=1737064 RepID=A0ABW5KMR5_9FLAO